MIGESAASLLFKLRGDSSDLVSASKDGKKAVDDLTGSATDNSSTLQKLAGPAQLAAVGIAAIGTAAIAAGSRLFQMAQQASEFGSQIFDASQKTGLSAERLSAMKFAADQSGASLDQITDASAKFARTIGEAANGSEKAQEKLQRLGVTSQDMDEALAQALSTIAKLPPGVQQMTAAQDAFGRSGAELLPFIKSFDGDLAALTERAKRLGVTINDDAMRAADEFGDQMDTLKAQLEGVARTIGFSVMPVFNEMASDMSSWLAHNKGEVTTWGDAFAVAMGNAYRNTKSLIDFVSDNRDWIKTLLYLAGPAGIALGAGIEHFASQVAARQAQRAADEAGEVDLSGLTPAQRRALTPVTGGEGTVIDAMTGKPIGQKVNTINVPRADSQSQVDSSANANERKQQQEAQAAINNERQTMAERIAIRESEYQKLYAIAERFAKDERKTEKDLIEYKRSLEEQLLEERKKLLGEYIAFLKEAGPEAADELRAAEHQMRLLLDGIEIKKQEYAKNQRDRNDAEKAADDDRNRRLDEEKKKRQELDDIERARAERRAAELASVIGGEGFGGGVADALGVELVSIFDEEKINVIKSQAEFLKGVYNDVARTAGLALGSMVQGLSQLVTAWISGGKFSAKAALQMAAGVAIGLAMQAAIKAVFEVAEGFAALARFDPVTAGLHFSAAKIYGITAAIAGGAGVALGLASRSMGGGQTAQTSFAAQTGGSRSRDTEGAGKQYSSFGDEVAIDDRSVNGPLAIRSKVDLTLKLNSDGVLDVIEQDANRNGRMKVLIERYS